MKCDWVTPTTNCTTHIEKQNVEHVVVSLTTNIMFEASYKSIDSQNHPTFHEHAIQGLHIILNKELARIHPSIHIHKKELPFNLNCLALCTN